MDGSKEQQRANIRGADFTNAVFADCEGEAFFGRVEAEGAKFGYDEDLGVRRDRHAASSGPKLEDTGALYNFNGSEGDFRNTRWTNVDFGGNSSWPAIFPGADLSGAKIEGCDLSGIDFTETTIDDIEITNLLSCTGMIIRADQMETMGRALKQYIEGWDTEKELREILEKEDSFGIVVVE